MSNMLYLVTDYGYFSHWTHSVPGIHIAEPSCLEVMGSNLGVVRPILTGFPLCLPFNAHRWVNFFFFVAQQPQSVLGRLLVEVLEHTRLDTPGRSLMNKWSTRRRGRSLLNTQQTQETYIYGLSRFRTGDHSNRPAADLRFKPHGHRYRPGCLDILSNVTTVVFLRVLFQFVIHQPFAERYIICATDKRRRKE